MAWNGNNDNWKWQLRDRKGRWIEMGRGVKWYSPRLGREVSGTVVGKKGKEAVVSLTSEPNDPKTGKPQQVNVKGSDIEVIASKATLGKPSTAAPATKAKVDSAPEDVDKAPIINQAKPSVTAPSRIQDIERDLGYLEQEAEDIGELEGTERAKALEEAEYPFTREDGTEASMGLVENDDDDIEIAVKDAKGAELGRFAVPDSLGSRVDTAKAIREAANGSVAKATIETPEKKEAQSGYNENGLTEEEQKQADSLVRLADRANKAGNLDAVNKYDKQRDALLKAGQDRKSGVSKAKPVAPTSPVSSSDLLGVIQTIDYNESKVKSDDLGAQKNAPAEEVGKIAGKGVSVALVRAGKGGSKYELRDSAGTVVAETPTAGKTSSDIAENLIEEARKVDSSNYTSSQPSKAGSTTASGLEIDNMGLTSNEQTVRTKLANEKTAALRRSKAEHAKVSMVNDKLSKALEGIGAKRLKGEDLPEVTREDLEAGDQKAPTTEAPKVADDKNIEPSIGQSMFPEGFSIQKDTFGRVPLNRMVSSHTGDMSDTELGKLKNLNKDYQLAQVDEDPKRIATSERELAKHARGIESRIKRDPEVTMRNRKIDALEVSDVNNVIKTDDPSDNWKKGEDGNWTHSKTGDVKNSADLVDIISPDTKSQTGYKPVRDKDLTAATGNAPAPETTDTDAKTSAPSAPVKAEPFRDEVMSVEDLKAIKMDKNLNEEYVKELTEQLRKDGVGDNIVMVEGPADDQYVGDGNHLIEAADRAGITELPVRIYANTPEGRAAANKAMAESENAKESGASRVTPKPEAPVQTPSAEVPKSVSEKAPTAPATNAADPLAAAGVARTEPYALPGEKFPPTRQQQDIIDSVLAGKNTAVQALAGSGKTTTLEALAKRIQEKFPDKKIAYIAFNKSVQLEAEGRMPENVESKTQHALAYGWADKWMKDRSNDRNSLRRADDVAGHLGIRNTIRPAGGGEPVSAKEQAMAAMRTVDTFSLSAEDVPDASHMPEKIREMGPEVEAAVLDAAKKIWADINKPDGKMRYSLDHMRKQWALTKPDLSKTGSGLKRKADIIFMDEAQDTPKVMAHLMDQQTAQMVVVGDSNQNIYSSFTGSIDYMSQVQKDVELPLTKSWRFGPEVADIGNRFLQLGDAPTRVEGSGAPSSIVTGMEEPDAILVRSNAGMLGEILGELEKGRKVGVPAGTKKDLQSLVASAAFLKGQGDAPPKMHDDLAAYRSWDEVVAEAEAGNATMTKIANMVNNHGIGGLRAILNEIVEKGGDGLEGFVLRKTADPNVGHADGVTFGNNNNDYLKQAGFKFAEIPGAEPMKSGKNKGKARKGWIASGTREEQEELFQRARELASGEAVDVTISTAHKSKGLEWNKVKIGEDFRGPKMNEETGEVEMPSAEELRVAYVAVTRAKKELDPGSLGYVFEYTEENGGTPKPVATEEPDSAKEDEQPVPSVPDDPEASSDNPEEDAPDNRPEDDANREEAERANREAEEIPAPEETPEEDAQPAPAPEEEPGTGEPVAEDGPVAKETPVPEEEQAPEPEPEDIVSNPEEVPEPAPLPKKPANTPAPEPEVEPESAPEPETPASAPAPAPAPEAPAPTVEDRPTTGTKAPESKPLHPVKAKAANYPDGTVIRSTRTGEAITKTGGQWHVVGQPNTPADPMDIDSPFVYDMPKQEDDSFERFGGINSVGPGDIIVTRKGTQAAVLGTRDGKLVVAAHNQTDEQRRMRPALAQIDPSTVKGVNKFAGSPVTEKTPAPERKRTPFSSNRGNSNVTIKDVSGNEIKIGDTVRTDKGTGTIVRVRPSDGPNGSAFVQFDDGTIKSFRSNKMRNTAFAEEAVVGGDDPAKMEIGSMGEAGDGRAFMVGKGNKPIFKGDNVSLADGTVGKVSGFAKGVQSVNIRVEGRASDLRKKASVVDAVDYSAPESSGTSSPAEPTSESPTDSTSADTTETPEPMEVESTPVVETPPNETPEEREERIATATSNSKDAPFLSSWWDIVMKDDLVESDIYKIAPDMQWKMEEMFKGELTRDGGGIMAAKGWGIAAWTASKDTNRSAEEREQMRDLQARITLFTQVQLEASENASREAARRANATVRKPDSTTPGENQSLKSDRALKPEAALKGAELAEYAGIEGGQWSDDLFGQNSRLNVLSPAGKDLGNTHVITNSRGNPFRQGVKVFSARGGRYIGVAKSVRLGSNGKIGMSVRKGEADATKSMGGGDIQVYDIEQLISEGAPPVWKKQPDLKFDTGDSASTISDKMARAYPGVDFKFRENIPLIRAREFAETTSKMLNKYPQLSATLTSVESSPIDPRIKAFAYASTSDHPGLRDTKVVFNAGIGKRVRNAMRSGADAKYFNNVPEGREMEYVMTHEFGHTLDYLTGNISENESYELMKELVPADVLANKRRLGKYLFDNGMVSEYSTEGNMINTVELVAESFADVEINGKDAKPISKVVHAELMRRLDEMSGGTGVLPAGPTV